MAAAPQDFHYMTVLRELEKALVAIHPAQAKVADSQLADVVSKLYGKVGNLKAQWRSLEEKIEFQLGAQQNRQIEIEEKIVRQIARLSGDLQHQAGHRRLTGTWPPMIPVARMLERFTALTIGLHSENPGQAFDRHVVAAFREAVIPGLAWGLMIQLYARPKNTRPAVQAALSQHLREMKPRARLYLPETEEEVRLDYLHLVKAWLGALTSPSLGSVSHDECVKLADELAGLIEKDLGELDTLLWEQLGGQYLSVIAGTERAMAVARADKHSAGSSAFLRERLALFEAAQHADLHSFRNHVETDLAKALKHPFEALSAAPGNIEAGKLACGGAFWLARATFGQHTHRDEQGRPLEASLHEKASDQTILLLVRAGLMFKHDAVRSELLLTCLRYAAGYATNPRYCRSLSVLQLQEKLVDLYEEHPLHRSALVRMFRGRIAWQMFEATNDKRCKKESLQHYHAVLEKQHADPHGLDAEAPVHFFPELTYLLRPDHSKASKITKTLDAVDFITQRNYGVYFDFDREKEKLDAGFKAYGRFDRLRNLAKNHASPLLTQSEETKGRINAFRQATESASAQATIRAIEELTRALHINR